MRPAKRSELFEQRIHRIHELLEGSGAVVTWDEHIPDPDNPDQLRQIDVTIRRGTHFTILECRIHRRRQDAQWIEGLCGRRQSLRADRAIAVSASGFTKGARNKGPALGVALRDLRDLDEDEVRSWGRSVSLSLLCYQYSNLELSLVLDGDRNTDVAALAQELKAHPAWQTLFNQTSHQLTAEGMITEEKIKSSVRFTIRAELEGFVLAGRRVRFVEFTGRASVAVHDVTCPVVESYGAPTDSPDAIVERFTRLGETTIVHDGPRVAVFVDLSKLDLPPLCQFQFVRTVSEQEMDFESFGFVGVEKLSVTAGRIAINLASYDENFGGGEAPDLPSV